MSTWSWRTSPSSTIRATRPSYPRFSSTATTSACSFQEAKAPQLPRESSEFSPISFLLFTDASPGTPAPFLRLAWQPVNQWLPLSPSHGDERSNTQSFPGLFTSPDRHVQDKNGITKTITAALSANLGGDSSVRPHSL